MIDHLQLLPNTHYRSHCIDFFFFHFLFRIYVISKHSKHTHDDAIFSVHWQGVQFACHFRFVIVYVCVCVISGQQKHQHKRLQINHVMLLFN